MVGLPEDTELSESPSFSFLNVGMSEVFLLYQQSYDETQSIFRLLSGFYSSIVSYTSYMRFQYLIKALESL